jgi:hypothetical protein
MLKSLTLGGSILRYGLVAAIGVISVFGVMVRYKYDLKFGGHFITRSIINGTFAIYSFGHGLYSYIFTG